jgi:hypothetical protein
MLVLGWREGFWGGTPALPKLLPIYHFALAWMCLLIAATSTILFAGIDDQR